MGKWSFWYFTKWFFEKVVKTAKIRCFSKKREIKRTVGKNIEKGYKIVIFLKKEIEKRRFFDG